MIFAQIWDTVVAHPILNILALFYDLLWNNMGLAIMALTLLIQVIFLPLTLRQVRQQQKLTALQPQLAALRKKYNTGRPEDKRKLSSETFRLYKQSGISPIGCLGPLIIQVPVWIAVYRAILVAVPLTPEGIVNLSRALYGWNPAANDVPFNPLFLGIDIAASTSQAPLALALTLCALVGGTLFLQQKLTSPANPDPSQRSTARIMLIFLPVMFAFFAWQFPAGLAVYITFSQIIGIVARWFMSGRPPLWGPEGTLIKTGVPKPAAAAAGAGGGGGAADGKMEEDGSERKEGEEYETYVGVHRKNSRRGNRGGAKRAGGKSRRH